MDDEHQLEEGYERAIRLLGRCSTEHGFLASPSKTANYHRVWARDGSIISLAALLTEDESLIETARVTFQTLAEHQGPHGEIPSNVDPSANRISYGGTTGRVDADMWFIIGCGEYWQATGDEEFLERILPTVEKVGFLLGAWEFNDRGLIYVPITGDWADEYLNHGYVLYDQLLYLQAQRTLALMHKAVHGSSDHAMEERTSRLFHLIQANYWLEDESRRSDAYHEVLFKKGRQAAEAHCAGCYWMPSFTASGYGYRFDAFANILVSLFDVANEHERSSVDSYIEKELVKDELPLLPAFHPVIEPIDEDWEELQVMFTYTFKNKPYEYHNGGLWPMLTGFYVADLAKRGLSDKAKKHLKGIHQANALEMDGDPWSFPEFVDGRSLEPGGTRQQGWSAAAAIIGKHALEGRRVFRIDHHEQ